MIARIARIAICCLIAAVLATCGGRSWTVADRREGITKDQFRVCVRVPRESLSGIDPSGLSPALRRHADDRFRTLVGHLSASRRSIANDTARLDALMPGIVTAGVIAHQSCEKDYCELFVDYPAKELRALVGE